MNEKLIVPPAHDKIGQCNRSICSFMNEAEEALTLAAILPVFGTLAGGVKITLGVSQLAVATTIAISEGLPMAAIGRKSILEYSWSHMKHGSGNIIAGVLEGTPGLGQSIAFREKRMPYSALSKAHCWGVTFAF